MGGFKDLIAYQLSTTIYDLNLAFCQKYIPKTSRTFDQMIQAARSGKQNIVEGSLEKSQKLNINLNSVARASLGELLEDYKDFLRTSGLTLWNKDDPRVLEIRRFRTDNWSNKTNLTYWANWTNSSESFANLMITLISLASYLLDQLIRKLESQFVAKGGYEEKLKERRKRVKGDLDLAKKKEDQDWLENYMKAQGAKKLPDGRFVKLD